MGLFSKKKSQPRPSPAKAPPTSSTRPTASTGSSSQPPARDSTTATAQPSRPQAPVPAGPDVSTDAVGYLKSLPAIRERTGQVFAQRARLAHFQFNERALPDVVDFVVSIVKRDYGTDYASIPPHGRWQHFEVGGLKRVDKMLAGMTGVAQDEKTRRVLDLFLVSVLLDAGAGNTWTYKAENGRIYRRSEGIAVASLEMFQQGHFSSDPQNKMQVDAEGLVRLTATLLGKCFQVSEQNAMSGLEGRTALLVRLGHALQLNQTMFGTRGRPGAMLDYLQQHPSSLRFEDGTGVSVPVTLLWSVLSDGLASIWPSGRTRLENVSLGDAWPYSRLPQGEPHARIVPFHKLSQWLAYSLMQPMTKLANVHFSGADLLTGLPEYRNGGLFVDLGVLTLHQADAERGLQLFKENAKLPGQQSVEVVPMFEADDDVIVEWRAMTVALLDQVHAQVNRKLGLTGIKALTLPQVLEAGTWKAGREMAEVQRPNTRGSPIAILSDGTLF